MKTARLLSFCILAGGLGHSAFGRTGYTTSVSTASSHALTAPELSLNSLGSALTALTIGGLFLRRRKSN